MKVLKIAALTEDDSEEPLYNTVFDDVDGIKELGKYARYEYVETVLDNLGAAPSPYLQRLFSSSIQKYDGSEKEFWINEITQEASFYLREVKKWIRMGRKSEALNNTLEDLCQYPGVLDSTAYLLKCKAKHMSRAPLVRLYILQLGNANEDPEFILLFEGIKLSYEISKCPGIVSSVFERTKLVIEELERL